MGLGFVWQQVNTSNGDDGRVARPAGIPAAPPIGNQLRVGVRRQPARAGDRPDRRQPDGEEGAHLRARDADPERGAGRHLRGRADAGGGAVEAVRIVVGAVVPTSRRAHDRRHEWSRYPTGCLHAPDDSGASERPQVRLQVVERLRSRARRAHRPQRRPRRRPARRVPARSVEVRPVAQARAADRCGGGRGGARRRRRRLRRAVRLVPARAAARRRRARDRRRGGAAGRRHRLARAASCSRATSTRSRSRPAPGPPARPCRSRRSRRCATARAARSPVSPRWDPFRR